MTEIDHARWAAYLAAGVDERRELQAITKQVDELSIDDAYAIQAALLELQLAGACRDGEVDPRDVGEPRGVRTGVRVAHDHRRAVLHQPPGGVDVAGDDHAVAQLHVASGHHHAVDARVLVDGRRAVHAHDVALDGGVPPQPQVAVGENAPAFVWNARSMEARVDLTDKEALWSALDRNDTRSRDDGTLTRDLNAGLERGT